MIAESISDRTLRRFTVDEYYAMMEAGILREEPGLELIDGLIVERPKMTRREGVRANATPSTIDYSE